MADSGCRGGSRRRHRGIGSRRRSLGSRPLRTPSAWSNICSILAYTAVAWTSRAPSSTPATDGPGLRPTSPAVERTALTRGAWVDVAAPGCRAPTTSSRPWSRDVPWRAERRQMYDRVVDVPRLVHTYVDRRAAPPPAARRGPRGAVRALPPRARRAVPSPPAAATTATAATASPGTATPSAAARPRTRWSRSSRSATRAGWPCGPRGGGESIVVRDGPRRPGRDGRLLPAHLGARRPQGRARRPADLGAVPAARRVLSGPRRSELHGRRLLLAGGGVVELALVHAGDAGEEHPRDRPDQLVQRRDGVVVVLPGEARSGSRSRRAGSAGRGSSGSP